MKHTEAYTSCLHTHVRYHVYEPKVVIRVKGVIQIHHGLCEHADRYDHFASFLLNHGFVVVVSDFVGHGRSLIDFEQGFFGMNRGSDGLVKDMFHLFDIIRSSYPDAPYFLLGIDLGALIIRKFMSIYGDYIQGVLLLGSSGDLKYAYVKKMQIKILKMIKGPMYRSKRIFKMFHAKNNKTIIDPKSRIDWMTRDEKQKRLYLDDPMTHFVYTLQGYEDMLITLQQVNSQEYIDKIPKYLSVYIACGEDDHLVNASEKLYEKYKKHGITDLTYKKFENCRHSLLFEVEKKEVYQNILNWLNERTYL